MKKYRECTKRKIERLLEKNLIKYENETFVYIANGKEVENIQLKKAYREGESDEDMEDDEEIDLSDDSASYKEAN